MVDFHVTQMRDYVKPQPEQAAQEVQRAQSVQRTQVADVKQTESRSQEEKEDISALRKAVDEMNDVASSFGKDLRFSISASGDSRDLVVQVVDPSNGEVIREFPSEELLELRAKFQANLGVIFNKEG